VTSPNLNSYFSSIPSEIDPFKKEIEVLIEAVLRGGKVMMPFYKSENLDVKKKKDGSRVTAADLAAHHEITRTLSLYFPHDTVVSEEGEKKQGQTKNRIWIVDPLDGTNDFIDETGEFCAMVGLAIDGESKVGGIFQPDPGILYFGISAGGSWKVDFRKSSLKAEKLKIGPHAEKPYRFVRSRTHFDKNLQALQKKLGEVKEIPCGSVGIKCALIAEDKADLYIHPVPYLKEWDTCAPEAILRGAGGVVTDTRGKPLTYGKTEKKQLNGIFAARKSVWNDVSVLII